MPNLLIGKYEGKTVGYGVCLDGPIASQFAHIYCKLGTKKIVLIGECGGIKKTIELGDIVVSEEVLSLDGVSSLYMQSKKPMQFDPYLRDEVEAKLKERGMRYRIGKTCSNDSDGDGLLYGLEDWNWDGKLNASLSGST